MRELDYRPRTLAGALERAAAQFPVVVLTGPRQSGKTTLVRHHFGATHSYCTLDDPSVRDQAARDPKLVLERFPPPVIFDEIQYVPELLHHIKVDVDAHRGQAGRYLLTGSQAFPLMRGVTESLAGRAAVLRLQSLSLRERFGHPEPEVPWRDLWSNVGHRHNAPAPVSQILDAVLAGGYPEPALRTDLDRELWFASYVQTYLERDVRALRAVGNLEDFRRFVFAVAARASGIVNRADLSRDVGVDAKTVKAWLSVLQASGQLIVLEPWFTNIGKRIVKSPKAYLTDTGVLSYLLGVASRDQLLRGIAAGPMFESAVLAELHRMFVHRGREPRLHFWRTADGHEVDFLVHDGTKLMPVEAKLTAAPTARHAVAVERFQKLLGDRASHGYVVCLCEKRFRLTETVDAVPLGSF